MWKHSWTMKAVDALSIIFLSLFLSVVGTGCSDRTHDPRLTRAEALISTSAEKALDSLLAINPEQLSDADRHYYDFLSVKIPDKAYIQHESDSLILKVIEYETNHKSNGRYAEALYYGGRVYSDLGDLPRALRYFQQSLSELPATSENRVLRSSVLSQTGRLLTNLSLHEEAYPYILEAIEINKSLKDTVNTIYDLQLVSVTCLRDSNYKQAEKYLKESLVLCKDFPAYHDASSRMYLAAVKYELEELDSALFYFRNTPESVVPLSRNSALAYGSTIYQKAGILDTAYLYAKTLISTEDPIHHEIGYQVLLSPELRSYIDLDTLYQYVAEYRTILVDYYDENSNQLALNQQNLYNYSIHEREKFKAEKRSSILRQWILVFLFISVLLGLISLYFKNKSKNNIIKLQRALNYIEGLKFEIASSDFKQENIVNQSDSSSNDKSNSQESSVYSNSITQGKNEHQLRECLKNELIALYENSIHIQNIIPSAILQSEAYGKIQSAVHNDMIIKDSDPLWKEIKQVVLSISPKFIENLNLLTLGTLTSNELHTALLIKCGIKPSKMAILLGRSNGAIVSRRETLSIKILDEKKGAKVIDGIIRLL